MNGQAAYEDLSLPLAVRFLALIQLKNGVDKYWRKSAVKYVLEGLLGSHPFQQSANDGAVLSAKMIKAPFGLGSCLLWFARLTIGLLGQLALVIAKIARSDFYHDWCESSSEMRGL